MPRIGRREAAMFAALIVLLLAPWPRWGRAFGVFFSGYGNMLVPLLNSGDGAPRFELPPRGQAGDWDVVLRAGEQVVPLETRIIGYTPLAVFVALALATPVPRRRKAIILVGGLAVLLLRLAFAILVPLGDTRAGGAAGIWTVLITPPAMSYAAPLAVWWLTFSLTTPARASTPAPAGARPAPRRRGGGRAPTAAAGARPRPRGR